MVGISRYNADVPFLTYTDLYDRINIGLRLKEKGE